MKIIFVAVFDKEGVSSNTSQAVGLEKLGHEVIRYNYRIRASAVGIHKRNLEIVKLCQELKPELVIFAKCNTVDTRVLIECKKHSTVCYWFPDPLVTYNDTEYYEKTRYADYFCCDKQNVLEKAREFNDNCYLIFDGYDSNLEYPKDLKQDIDVSFIGNCYGDRKKKIDSLSHEVEVISDAYGSRHSEVVSRSKINLNFCTTLGASDRIYKVLGARGFILSDDWVDREKSFEDGKHLVIYKDVEDLDKKIEYYLAHEEERERIREAGYHEIQKYTRDAWAVSVVNLYNEMPKKEKVLVAGPWVGEFGWELFAWQAYIREISAYYDKTICIARKNSEAIYKDFCDEFVSFEPKGGLADAFFMHGLDVNQKLFLDLVGDKINIARNNVTWFPPRRIGIPPHTHFLEEIEFNNLTVTPNYVIFDGNDNTTCDIPYDYIFHMRNRQLRSEDNWPMEHWQALYDSLTATGKTVACVGTKAESLCIKGAADLRDIELKKVFKAFNQAECAFGPSSGPMHLASLCGCPHVVWSTGANRTRYEKNWNPHQTPVLFLDEHVWQPPPEFVYTRFVEWQEESRKDMPLCPKELNK